VEASDDTMRSLNELQQSVRGLQASQQQMADQLELIQRQLASEQGERKMLSEQVGALSGRVDGLSTPATSVTTGTTSQSPKKNHRGKRAMNRNEYLPGVKA
jgi:Tfp pilus assembly protein FimV